MYEGKDVSDFYALQFNYSMVQDIYLITLHIVYLLMDLRMCIFPFHSLLLSAISFNLYTHAHIRTNKRNFLQR